MKKNAYGYALNEKNTDVTALCREVFNPHKFDIIFKSFRPEMNTLHDSVIICNAGERVFLPHGYYMIEVPTDPSIEQVVVQTSFGSDMKSGKNLPQEDLKKLREHGVGTKDKKLYM